MRNRFMLAMCSLQVCLAAGAVGFPEPSDFNPRWESASPGSSFDRTIPTAALMGNGSLGAVNGGDADRKRFVLTRGDLWSCGAMTAGWTHKDIIPISFAVLDISPGTGSVGSTDTLDISSATLVTEGKFGVGCVKIESYVPAGEDLLVVTGVSDVDASWALKLEARNEIKEFPRDSGASADGFWVERSTLNLLPPGDPRGWVTNAVAAVSVLGAGLENAVAPERGTAAATVRISAGKPFAIVVSHDRSRRFTWDDLAAIRRNHAAWWKEWWSRSRIATGDAELDRFYCGQVYLLGAGVRGGKFPPGLYGLWVTTDSPKWHNDFHLNYNYVATWYGCFAANRCDTAASLPDPLLDYLPQAMVNAKEGLQKLDRCFSHFFRNTRAYLDRRPDLAAGIDDAALYPVALGPWGAAPEGHGALWSQVSDGVFQVAVMCTHWEYTLDREYLRKVWPLMEKTANFFLKWREKESMPGGGYRYNIWDSHWEGSGLQKNSAAALGCVKHLFATLVGVAGHLREIGIDVPDATFAVWKDMHEHLSDLPVGVFPIDGKPVKMLSGVENRDGSANPAGGNAVNLESIIPGEAFSFDVTVAMRTLATNAVDGNLAVSKRAWAGINQTPKLFATAIRAGYSAKKVIDAFKAHQLSRMQRNFHIRDGVHGVEKIGSMEFLQSMFIQCDRGIVKIFPNWTLADAKFENLRAKGCFLVSAEMKAGKTVRVEVFSEKGGFFRLVDPFAGGYLPDGWSRSVTRNSREPVIEREFRPGERLVLEGAR